MIELVRYTPEHKKLWDEFVESSKNGTFLFNRDYMDYHADRFEDHSYLIYLNGSLYCLLPANRWQNVLFSHQGLTYGGFIMNEKCTVEIILKIYDHLKKECAKSGIKKIVYKPVPHIYHGIPSEEDLYALFYNQCRLTTRNVSSVIDLNKRIGYSTLRKRRIKKSIKNNLRVEETNDYPQYWEILQNNLKEKYKASPVHSVKEITMLSKKFPEIKLFCAFLEEEMLGGVVCYLTHNVVKVQYISATEKGKSLGAIDAIFYYLIEGFCKKFKYLDFGTSNENGGKYLNETLIHQKEGFGGRAICYDTYEIEVNI